MLRRCRPLLGTFVEIAADDEAAIGAAFAAIDEVHRLMSAHDPDSDVSRVNRDAHDHPVEVHGWTARVLERALFWARESAGAFDPVRAGKAAIASGYLPRHADQPAPEAGHWTWLEVEGRSVRLMKPGCIDLGGIAKGFAVDQAIAALKRAGATSGLVNAGGDVAAFGSAPWPIHIADPRTRAPAVEIALDNEALATSAVIDGDRTHLPGSGRGWLSATVRAPAAIDADALTKIVLAGSPQTDHCLQLARAEAFRVSADGRIDDLTRAPLAA